MEINMEMEGKIVSEKESMMSLKDAAARLVEDFPDEIKDSHKYLKMAKVLDKTNHCDDAVHYLMEMAKDEYTHAKFIHEFMSDHNITVPADQEKDFKELEEKIEKFFR